VETYISIIIPNYNGSATIGRCLAAASSSRYAPFEIVVVDDSSTDDSAEIIGRYPCRLIRLNKRSGASSARNAGARNSTGGILFFIDSDCLIQVDTLAILKTAFDRHDRSTTVLGGTYTALPDDNDFFSTFQSIFVSYFETKEREPDYLATHALAIDSAVFKKSGGFSEDFFPILEDVEFSHRLRRAGYRLVMDPRILVRHVFRFTLLKSLRNAFRKSMFWTLYSLRAGDLLSDSGTASRELKINGLSFVLIISFVAVFLFSRERLLLLLVPLTCLINAAVNSGLVSAFSRARGSFFALVATAYYVLLYPLPVLAGAIVAVMRHFLRGVRI